MGVQYAWTDLFDYKNLQDKLNNISNDLSFTIDEDDTHLIVTMKAPNIDIENIEIDIQDNILYVDGEQNIADESSGEGYYHKKVSSEVFSRVIYLPYLVDRENTVAEIENNELTITMPKIKEEEKKNKIKIVRKD